MLTILVGKSGSGKDAIQQALCEENMERFVTATTRPMRVGEVDGIDYHFMSKEDFQKGIEKDDFIEHRSYDTLVQGNPDTWYYGSPKQTLSNDKDYVIILDAQGAADFLECYGRENCFVVSVEVPDAVREERAKARGSFDQTEWDRRLADDNVKFSGAIIDDVANFYLYNTNDLETAVIDVMEALEAYDHTVKEVGNQYLVVEDIVGGYGSYDPPENVFHVYDKQEYDKMLAEEDRMVTEAEYGYEMMQESEMNEKSSPTKKPATLSDFEEATKLLEKVLVVEYKFSESNANAYVNDGKHTAEVAKLLSNYVSMNGKGRDLMMRAIEEDASTASLKEYANAKSEKKQSKSHDVSELAIGDIMNSKKVALIDFIIFFAAYMITDKIFPEANELLKLFLSVALVLLGTFVAKELFKYDEENDNDE